MNPFLGKAILFCGTPDQGKASDCVNWAIEALGAGKDTPHLRMLAGLAEPLNPFEVRTYTELAFTELALPLPQGEEAVTQYAKSLVDEILNNPAYVRANLGELAKLCQQNEYQPNLYAFYLLRWALHDLDAADVQHYWEGATQENIEAIVLQRCKDFLQKVI